MTEQKKTWGEHKAASDLLWDAFEATGVGTKAREDAKKAYLAESEEFWGEESLGITQLWGRQEKE